MFSLVVSQSDKTHFICEMFCLFSSDGAIKIWDENKFLMTEVMLEESLSAACFLNDLGDLLVGFKNHIFYIDHAKCKWFINLILQVPND